MSAHSIDRTSPKGEPFVGRCVLCGRPNLTDPYDGECANPGGVSEAQALVDAIERTSTSQPGKGEVAVGRGIPCWPEGHATPSWGGCDEEIPDDDYETMERFGWGWVWAHDPSSASGRGPFLACPEHRSDVTEEQREEARRRCAAAKAALSQPEAGSEDR